MDINPFSGLADAAATPDLPQSTPPSSLTLLLMASPWAASPSSYLQTEFQRQQKTFVL